MQDFAFGVHLVEFHVARFRHTQAMTEHQEQQATVARLVPAPLGRLYQPFNLAPGEVLCFSILGIAAFPYVKKILGTGLQLFL